MELKEALGEIYKTAREQFDIQNTPKLNLKQDEENAQGIFGKTAYYDPSDMSVVLYITNRHPKDICRSFAHELIHHVQNERGDLKGHAEEGADGSIIENEANSKAGEIIRIFGKQNPEIYTNNK